MPHVDSKPPSHVPQSNISNHPNKVSRCFQILFNLDKMPLAVGIWCIMCHEVADEQHGAAVHSEHTAGISDSVVAGHCVSPMSCAMIHSFPESLETCTNMKSSGIKCAKSIMSVVCVRAVGCFRALSPLRVA